MKPVAPATSACIAEVYARSRAGAPHPVAHAVEARVARAVPGQMKPTCPRADASPAASDAETLNELAAAIDEFAAPRPSRRSSSSCTRAARRLTNADGATLILREGRECHYVDEDAIEPLWKGRRFPLEHCISGWAMQHREPAVVEDIYADARIPHDLYRPTFVRSLLVAPIGRSARSACTGRTATRRATSRSPPHGRSPAARPPRSSAPA